MLLVDQELFTAPENVSLPPVILVWVVLFNLQLYVQCFADHCLFCPCSLGHYIVCPSSIYGSDYPFGLFKLVLLLVIDDMMMTVLYSTGTQKLYLLVVVHQDNNPKIHMPLCQYTCRYVNTHYLRQPGFLNVACLWEKQQIPILQPLFRPERRSNSQTPSRFTVTTVLAYEMTRDWTEYTNRYSQHMKYQYIS